MPTLVYDAKLRDNVNNFKVRLNSGRIRISRANGPATGARKVCVWNPTLWLWINPSSMLTWRGHAVDAQWSRSNGVGCLGGDPFKPWHIQLQLNSSHSTRYVYLALSDDSRIATCAWLEWAMSKARGCCHGWQDNVGWYLWNIFGLDVWFCSKRVYVEF